LYNTIVVIILKLLKLKYINCMHQALIM